MASISVDVVLLAAGLSRRMGEPNKLLLAVDGEPLVRRSLRLYRDITDRLAVVVGHEAERVLTALEGLPHAAVFNEAYATGQRSSVRAGLAAVGAHADAVLIALADQPLLTSCDVRSLVDAFRDSSRDKILIPYQAGRRGNPVLIPRSLVGRLLAEDGNPWCRRFIDRHPELVQRIAVANDHFTTDLDTPEDARALGIPAAGAV